MKAQGILRILGWMVLAVAMVACGAKTNMESFLRGDTDMSYVTRIAVAPFENSSKEQFAAERVRGVTITQILARGLFDVVDKGLVDSALREEAIDLGKSTLDAAVLKRLSQKLNVQAFLLGAVDQAGEVQRGSVSYPQLSVTLRLVDASTGAILWQASGSRNGDSMAKRLLGVGSEDEFRLALHLTDQLLASLTASEGHKVKLPGSAAVVPAATPQVVKPEPPSEPAPAAQEAPAEPGAAPAEVAPGQAEPLGPEPSLPPATDEAPAAPAPTPAEGLSPGDDNGMPPMGQAAPASPAPPASEAAPSPAPATDMPPAVDMPPAPSAPAPKAPTAPATAAPAEPAPAGDAMPMAPMEMPE